MSDSPSPTESVTLSPEQADSDRAKLTPLRCVTGSLIAATLAYAMYWMTSAIAHSFAAHKIQSANQIVQRISAAVRTLVVGMTSLGTGVFGLAAIGLLALAVQIIIQRARQAEVK